MIDPKHHFFHIQIGIPIDTNHSMHAPQQVEKKKKWNVM